MKNASRQYCNPSFLLFSILSVYFLVALIVYVPNMGGDGLRLPHNIICWAVMLFMILVSGYYVILRGKIKLNESLTFFIGGACLMSLPFLWGKKDVMIFALPRFAGLWGGIFFYLALLQIPMRFSMKTRLIIVFVLSALIQSCLAFWQLLVTSPDNFMEFLPGTRPYGIFQQVNVLASFVATGYACTLWLLFKAKTKLSCFLLLFSTVVFTVTLEILQSRAGMYGIVLYLALILLARHRPKIKGVFIVYIMLVILTLLTIHCLKSFGIADHFLRFIGSVDKEGTNAERWKIITITLSMIQQHPLSGWGYGSYEYNLSRFALHHFDYLFGRVDNAHNEFLFEWAEGGVLAISGMIFIAIGYFTLLRRCSPSRIAMWGLALPITFHMMVEYPLLLSTSHWMLLLLICRLATSEKCKIRRNNSKRDGMIMLSVGITGVLFMLTGFRTGMALTEFERNKMQDFTAASKVLNPWAQWERWQYDSHTSLLFKYYQTHQHELLISYEDWGKNYLMHRNDIRVFKNIVQINRKYPQQATTMWLQQQWYDYYQFVESAHKVN
ncbi:PglL family O-oligosaccharyltransferase [Enterobacter vonholyi]